MHITSIGIDLAFTTNGIMVLHQVFMNTERLGSCSGITSRCRALGPPRLRSAK